VLETSLIVIVRDSGIQRKKEKERGALKILRNKKQITPPPAKKNLTAKLNKEKITGYKAERDE